MEIGDSAGKEEENVTERVDARLVRGDYSHYEQLAKEEGTSPGFVAKRAYILKKDGRLYGDRRTAGIDQKNGDTRTRTNMNNENYAERIPAYRLVGVAEEDIRIMEAGHIDLSGLMRIRQEARALRYDKMTEEVAKEFPNLERLKDFKEFYTIVRKTGLKRQQYLHVMNQISESSRLEEHLEAQELEIGEKNEKIEQLTEEGLNLKVRVSSLTRQTADLSPKYSNLVTIISKMETKKASIELFFKDIAEGRRGSAEIYEIVKQEYGKLLTSDHKWLILTESLYAASLKHPNLLLEVGEAIRASRKDYIKANASRFGQLWIVANELFVEELARAAAETARGEVGRSLQTGRLF